MWKKFKELDQLPIHKAIKNYGIENFIFEIICEIENESKEKLIDEDYYLVSGYIFYSNPNISNGINENISPLARKMVDMYGSGNFNDAELKVLQKIHEEGKNIIEKESPKRR